MDIPHVNDIVARYLNLSRFILDLPPEKWDFGELVTKHRVKRKPAETVCGTVCCAIGWMPKVDAENWKWELEPNFRSGVSVVGYIDGEWRHFLESAVHYFFMPDQIARAIFAYPHDYEPDLARRTLKARRTREVLPCDVARRLLFCADLILRHGPEYLEAKELKVMRMLHQITPLRAGVATHEARVLLNFLTDCHARAVAKSKADAATDKAGGIRRGEVAVIIATSKRGKSKIKKAKG